jgi:hypothetical protein
MHVRFGGITKAAQHFGVLLIALVLLLVLLPLLEVRPYWDVVVPAAADLVLIACLYAARPGGALIRVGVALAVADFAIGWIASATSSPWLSALQLVLWLSILLFVTAAILRVVFTTRTVTLETLTAALCVFLLIGFIWAFIFAAVEATTPDAFRSASGRAIDWQDMHSRRAEFTKLLILSFSTLSGAGGGDLSPATSFATMLTCLEAMTGQVFMAVVIARLVGVQSAAEVEEDAKAEDVAAEAEAME